MSLRQRVIEFYVDSRQGRTHKGAIPRPKTVVEDLMMREKDDQTYPSLRFHLTFHLDLQRFWCSQLEWERSYPVYLTG